MTQPQADPIVPANNEQPGQVPPAPPAPTNDNGNRMTLDQAEKELAKVRQEAANYRTQLRAEQAKSQMTPEDIAKRIAELEDRANTSDNRATVSDREALVLTVGRDLPDDLLQMLRDSSANTKEDLEAKAKVLREYAGKAPKEAPPEKLGGGLNGGTGEDGFNAADVVKSVRARRG